MSYINKEELISEIRDHAKRIGSGDGDFDLYQLAHYHIIRIIEQTPPADPYLMDRVQIEESFICGYRVKDLIVVAQRLRKDNIDPVVLQADNEAFLEGYKRAYDEINASIKESIDKIISRE